MTGEKLVEKQSYGKTNSDGDLGVHDGSVLWGDQGRRGTGRNEKGEREKKRRQKFPGPKKSTTKKLSGNTSQRQHSTLDVGKPDKKRNQRKVRKPKTANVKRGRC